MRSLGLIVMTVVLGMASAAVAQQPPESAPPQTPAPIDKPVTQGIDPTKLGIDLNKVQRGLAIGTPEERLSASGLRLNYRVEVFGELPKMDFFENFDPKVGPVPFGAPTHKDFLDMVTPQEFRAPMFNFSALAFWAFGKLGEMNARQQCEAELAEYKSRVLRGIPTAAPQCAR
jgi:hypothetical protein